MRILDYIIAGIVEGILLLGVASLIGMGLAQLVNRKSKQPAQWHPIPGTTQGSDVFNHYVPQSPNYRRPRFWWLEELRAKRHMQNMDRLARQIERKLERRRGGWPWDLG